MTKFKMLEPTVHKSFWVAAPPGFLNPFLTSSLPLSRWIMALFCAPFKVSTSTIFRNFSQKRLTFQPMVFSLVKIYKRNGAHWQTTFCLSGFSLSSTNKLKVEFRLLTDLVDKSLLAKAFSFDKITVEKLMVMISIAYSIEICWSDILFNIFCAMSRGGYLVPWLCCSNLLNARTTQIQDVRHPEALPHKVIECLFCGNVQEEKSSN